MTDVPTRSKTPGIVMAVVGVLVLVGSCLPFGGAAYLWDSAESHRSLAESYEPRPGDYSDYTSDPVLADLYRGEARDEEQMSIGSACCGSTCCLASIALLVAAAVTISRARR